MSDKKDLTIKQRVFVKSYLETGGNGTQSALVAYNCSNAQSGDAVSREVLGNPRVHQAICELMRERGLDDDSLLTIHKELLEDKDPAIRLRALDMAYKLSGQYQQAQIIVSKTVETKIPITPIVISREEVMQLARERALEALEFEKEFQKPRAMQKAETGF